MATTWRLATSPRPGLRPAHRVTSNAQHALESGVDPEYPTNVGLEQDLFTWFTLVGLRSTCHQNTTIASQECA